MKRPWPFVVAVVCLLPTTPALGALASGDTDGALVYSKTYPRRLGIFTINADGTGKQRLTRGEHEFPRWSPDGTRIAFVAAGSDGERMVVMNADGSESVVVTGAPRGRLDAPVWSPDATEIAFVDLFYRRDQLRSAIKVASADGDSERRLTGYRSGNIDPDWSPDGSSIVFVRTPRFEDAELWTMAPDGSGKSQLTDDDVDETAPVWSSDGSQIAYVTDLPASPAGGETALAVIGADGSVPQQITDPGAASDYFPSWSPNDEAILFLRSGPTNQGDVDDVYVANSDGTGLLNLSSEVDGYVGSAVWSPGGTRVAFETSDIFVVDRDGSDLVQITDTRASESYLDWQPLPETP